MKGVKVYFKKNTLIIESELPMEVLSSAIFNGGRTKAKYIINHRVPENFTHKDVHDYMEKVVRELGLPLSETVGLLTGVDIHKASIINDSDVLTVVTAGVSNAATAGDSICIDKAGVSTINIIVVIDGSFSENAFIDAIIIATEAKTLALSSLDIRSRVSGRVATGTTTDAIVVACKSGVFHNFSGAATQIGFKIAKNVFNAVVDAIKKYEGITNSRPLLKRLEEWGITLDDLIETAMELYIHHPSMGSIEDVKKTLREILLETLHDVNVASLILAGKRIEEDGERGLIPGLPVNEFKKDPVYILADEILGMAIANYIAGSRGIFEYYRFDRVKPGILKKLGPFMDDVIGGLIGGASSLMYTKLIKEKR